MSDSYSAPPSNGLVGAILATLFCCVPFGIVAIVKAAQVNSLWAAGQRAAAEQAADAARNWTLASIITGLAVGAVYFFVALNG
ncbi:MAG TPA: CD225/dispanin family protein [Glycomyces sp.]|nr:CD225/dispanin family protein [Glycomyces sp.]